MKFKPKKLTCRIINGNALSVLKKLPNQSVHGCVTSPPYFGLRKYTDDHHQEIGREETVAQYIKNLVDVFTELRRVLRNDGHIYLNINDKWANNSCGNANFNKRGITNSVQNIIKRKQNISNNKFSVPTKNMCLVPQRLVIALQDAGWIVRSIIIWHKPGCLPTSVKDRPTNTFEYVFLLSKQAKYYYDHEATKEDATYIKFKEQLLDAGKRNPRDVWLIPVQVFKGGHFATYPVKLVAKALLSMAGAGGVCEKCGMSYQRITKKGKVNLGWQKASGGDKIGKYHGKSTKNHKAYNVQDASEVKARILAGLQTRITIGWQQGCSCKNTKPVPATIIDPFAGSGTTGQACFESNRNAILIELNKEFIPIIKQRLNNALLTS